METHPRTQKLQAELEEMQGLVLQAEAEATPDALAAKSLFLQIIARLELQLAKAESRQNG